MINSPKINPLVVKYDVNEAVLLVKNASQFLKVLFYMGYVSHLDTWRCNGHRNGNHEGG